MGVASVRGIYYLRLLGDQPFQGWVLSSLTQASRVILLCHLQGFINFMALGWQVLNYILLDSVPSRKESGRNKRGFLFLFSFIAGGKHFPETSSRLSRTSWSLVQTQTRGKLTHHDWSWATCNYGDYFH